MGDEIRHANVARVEQQADGTWLATLGPDPDLGLAVTAPSGRSALLLLAIRAVRVDWIFDDTWQWRDHTDRPGRA